MVASEDQEVISGLVEHAVGSSEDVIVGDEGATAQFSSDVISNQNLPGINIGIGFFASSDCGSCWVSTLLLMDPDRKCYPRL